MKNIHSETLKSTHTYAKPLPQTHSSNTHISTVPTSPPPPNHTPAQTHTHRHWQWYYKSRFRIPMTTQIPLTTNTNFAQK